MKNLLFLLFFCFSGTLLQAQSSNPQYDKALADSLGGDDYGMKMYTFIILKTGPNPIHDKKIRDSLFAGHMANINRLADMGKLVVAGPFETNAHQYRGLFILNVNSTEEAKALLDQDPVLHSKLMEAEIFQWYGSAALPKYLPFHEKIEKKKM
ncbi:MAG: YciI family protein [Taibaiella sp.]|jgi:uncharacterized protein YciI